MKPHHINQQNNFIGGWYHNDIALCDDIIQFHKESPSVSKNPGYTYKGDVCTVDFDVKNSVEGKVSSLLEVIEEEIQK